MTRYLDLVWTEVNSLGAPDTAITTIEERAYNDAIGDVLEIIESLGGCDPLQRRAEERDRNLPLARFDALQGADDGPEEAA